MSFRHLRQVSINKILYRRSSDKAAQALKAYHDNLAAVRAHAAETANLWKKITFFFALPLCGIVAYNSYVTEMEHLSHGRPEFKPYAHLRIRNKPFPWGDGNHSFFHGHYNALPDGYED